MLVCKKQGHLIYLKIKSQTLPAQKESVLKPNLTNKKLIYNLVAWPEIKEKQHN